MTTVLSNKETFIVIIAWIFSMFMLLGFAYYMLNVFGKIEPEQKDKKF